MIKYEARKKKPITQKNLKNIRVKINNNNNNNKRANKKFNWKVKLNWKIALAKGKIR